MTVTPRPPTGGSNGDCHISPRSASRLVPKGRVHGMHCTPPRSAAQPRAPWTTEPRGWRSYSELSNTYMSMSERSRRSSRPGMPGQNHARPSTADLVPGKLERAPSHRGTRSVASGALGRRHAGDLVAKAQTVNHQSAGVTLLVRHRSTRESTVGVGECYYSAADHNLATPRRSTAARPGATPRPCSARTTGSDCVPRTTAELRNLNQSFGESPRAGIIIESSYTEHGGDTYSELSRDRWRRSSSSSQRHSWVNRSPPSRSSRPSSARCYVLGRNTESDMQHKNRASMIQRPSSLSPYSIVRMCVERRANARTRAAIKIQSVFRAVKQRRWLNFLYLNALFIQTVYRGYRRRHWFRKMARCIVRIQAHLRGRYIRYHKRHVALQAMRLIYRKKASIRAKIDRQMTIYHKFRRLALTYLASDKRKGCKLNFGVQGGATTDADLNMDEGFSAWSNMKTRMDKRMNGRGGKENIARNARRSSVAENDAYVLQGARKRRQSVEIEINDEMYENLQAITVDVGKRKLNKRERKLHRVVAQVNAASKLQNKSTDWSTGQIVRLPNGTFAAAFSPDNPNIGWRERSH